MSSPVVSFRPSRRALLVASVATAMLAVAQTAVAAPRLVDVDIVDRDTGRTLDVYQHRGRSYVAGAPGVRYAIRITNRSGGRVMAVTSVDGVNIVSGQTAAWLQTGYVFEPGQSYELTGWRKSDDQVAAFAFTSLPDSYAARTGRALDVGVIGVAVFREKAKPAVPWTPPWGSLDYRERRAEPRAEGEPASRSAVPRPAPAAAAQAQAEKAATPERDDFAQGRLGTAHGEREYSQVSRTRFERAGSAPDQVVSIQYDRYQNLVAAGVVGSSGLESPRPFPATRNHPGYVQDPPAY